MNHPGTQNEIQAIPLATPDQLRERIRRKSKLKGRQPEAEALREVRELLGPKPDGGWPRDLLIEHLHRLNDASLGLHDRHLVALASLTNIPMAEVYEVATFYHHFEILRGDEQAPGLTVRVCDGLACELAGARDLLARLPALLGAAGRQDVRVISAPCIGRCEQAPAAAVHQRAVPMANADKILLALESALPPRETGHFEPSDFAEKSVTPPLDAVQTLPPFTDYATYRANGGYALAAALVNGEQDAQAVVQAMEDSGLRGLGGAGFPAGRKWRIVREQPAPRLMAVNIDEGEPGTFKDRAYLERDPHRFLEGLLIAAQVVGTEACYIYLRDEYHDCRALLEAELARLRADPPCELPRIELRRGAGAYICGEESAMIESIEGKRGEPRMRPPYIAQVGLFGRPTLEHNFETLYWVRDIVQRGPQWFSGFGRHGRKGLRSFSVSGRVKQPGVKLAPAGITVQELIDEYCGGMMDGHQLYAYLPGGASGGILPARMNDIPLDFDTLQPHGCFIGSAAVMVLSQHDKARDAARNVMRFFEHESCGQCTPCRVGTAKAAALMEAPVWDQATLEDLAQVMGDASICGLGQAAPNPIRCIQKYFPQEIE
ncbi:MULTISPECIES: NADH-ubiquinone oxidoreductase-F iron-sulfur binding region domain-containing protein [unclassified Variovorax]|uniref:NADH-ubiquinone oxidoreductase-F iron-sulfur binding region domain-containing protein n=1 Tax=unclassified Variovorax TaxID=663243 RepID=UPI00076C1B03|nr:MULTISPECIES: NADH-ubiquinone oxidoreductase-F iron-sulfur binding region domain-containing protein [unclassified Variovorax]KWT83844.1 tungsten-containing formate dehydrogenase beta subunit [Variovorax sp. WDL1]PNG46523.1 NADH-quinone oxidoreductase subunit F [Variovorax sp. B2]PNG47655.1 NADH-quinone oxidoreductase subunit F [Variovorax sp. B4]VTV14283.1 NADH-quinone oxidoreductase subunit F [Variovorax sp. WDL1]